jgi:predicted GNAT family N-acyltransferase
LLEQPLPGGDSRSTLQAAKLAIAELPPEYAKRLPRYDLIPSALIGRLARDQKVRGEGVGDLLLADAIRRVIGASRSLAVFAIVVAATNEKAAAFYRDFGFAPFPNHPLRLFIPASEAVEAVSRALSR